jgi:MoaA/NifB/PqqE/SkfB family radical SAM enzyme
MGLSMQVQEQHRPVGRDPGLPESVAATPRFGHSVRGIRYSRFLRCWVLPYVRSRIHGGFRPIFGCVYTEWKCNLDCTYCRSHDNSLPGMDEETARRTIDWLHATGCRAVGLMGGEPLIRAAFVDQFVRRAAGKGFYVYLPTNGRLLTPDVTDRLGDAGVATVNVAIDCIREKPGLPKALEHIRPNFDYLVRLQSRYGYTVFLSINITRFNLDDVRLLTEFSRRNGIATAYHLCESPRGHAAAPVSFGEYPSAFRSEDAGPLDDLLDYLIDCSHAGYAMVNSIQHLRAMKGLLRGGVAPWLCRAGQNMVVCLTDGALKPCYPLRESEHDWGTVGCQKFDAPELAERKQSCSQSCFSTVAFMLANYYDVRRVADELSVQMVRRLGGFGRVR